MKTALIRSGKDAHAAIMPADAIDWTMIDKLNLWMVEVEDRPGRYRYAINAVFADDTWVWTAMLDDEIEARQAIQRLAAERGKTIERLGPGVIPHVPGY